MTDSRADTVELALSALLETRWNPVGDIGAWSKTPDGNNHALVMLAIEALRGKGPAPDGRGAVCQTCDGTREVSTYGFGDEADDRVPCPVCGTDRGRSA